MEKTQKALQTATETLALITEKITEHDEILAGMQVERGTLLEALADGTPNEKALKAVTARIADKQELLDGLTIKQGKAQTAVTEAQADLNDAQEAQTAKLTAFIAEREAEYQSRLSKTAPARVRALAAALVALQIEYGEIYTESFRNGDLSRELGTLGTYHLAELDGTGRFQQEGSGFYGPVLHFRATTTHFNLAESGAMAVLNRSSRFAAEFK